MRKALKNKLNGTKNIIRRALSLPSNSLQPETSPMAEEEEEEETRLRVELDALRDQIENLRAAVMNLRDETERKEVAIADLAREKERESLELLRMRRANERLSRQLEEERRFYMAEKEAYCREMNECKRLRRLASEPDGGAVGAREVEVEALKRKLSQTLEANYNLSIKFLRMKNTKACLKTELQTVKLEYEKLIYDYKTKIEHLSTELNDLVNERMISPLSPSNKKYLQLVKQNGCLVYENLCLQLEVDNLNYRFQKLKLEKAKSETNQRLQYIHHDNGESETKAVNVGQEAPERLEEPPRLVKIFEGKDKSPEADEERRRKRRKHRRKEKLITLERKALSCTSNPGGGKMVGLMRSRSLPDVLRIDPEKM